MQQNRDSVKVAIRHKRSELPIPFDLLTAPRTCCKYGCCRVRRKNIFFHPTQFLNTTFIVHMSPVIYPSPSRGLSYEVSYKEVESYPVLIMMRNIYL